MRFEKDCDKELEQATENIQTGLEKLAEFRRLELITDKPLMGDEPDRSDPDFGPTVLGLVDQMKEVTNSMLDRCLAERPVSFREPLRKAIMAGDMEEISRLHSMLNCGVTEYGKMV